MKEKYFKGKLYITLNNFGSICIGGEVQRRIVTIELTPEQNKLLTLRHTHTGGAEDYFEEAGICVLENLKPQPGKETE